MDENGVVYTAQRVRRPFVKALYSSRPISCQPCVLGVGLVQSQHHPLRTWAEARGGVKGLGQTQEKRRVAGVAVVVMVEMMMVGDIAYQAQWMFSSPYFPLPVSPHGQYAATKFGARR